MHIHITQLLTEKHMDHKDPLICYVCGGEVKGFLNLQPVVLGIGPLDRLRNHSAVG